MSTEQELDLTISGFSINVQKHDEMIDAVEAIARSNFPQDFIPVEDDEVENVVEITSKVEENNATLQETTIVNKMTEASKSMPPAPEAHSAVAPILPPSAQEAEAGKEEQEVLVGIPNEEPSVLETAVLETAVLETAVLETAVPETVHVEKEEEGMENLEVEPEEVIIQQCTTKKSVRLMKGKATRVKKKTMNASAATKNKKRRETMCTSSLASKKTKKNKKKSPVSSRGRTKDRIKKNSTAPTHRRASSDSFATKSTKNGSVPSYLRPTRSSSLSQETAVKRKNDRRCLSQSRSIKTGFGGHTYQSNRTKKVYGSLTEPKAFRLSTSERKRETDSKQMTTEEMELLKIQKAQKNIEKRRKMNEKSLRRSAAGSIGSVGISFNRKSELTKPKEFSLSKSKREQSKQLTSEELEMKKIHFELKKAKKLREKNKKTIGSYDQSVLSRSTKRLTTPSSPKLKSRTRPKANLTQRKREAAQKNRRNSRGSSSSCLSRPTATNNGPVRGRGKNHTRQLTKPSTPKFATDLRAKLYKEMHKEENSGSPHEVHQSLAEQVMKINNEIPERFHSKPRNHKRSSSSNSATSNYKSCHQLTEPVAPNFATDLRASNRPLPKSTEEMEIEKMKELQSKPFRAKPLDPRIMNSSGDMGVPRLSKKPLTKCESPKFRVDKRASIERPQDYRGADESMYKPFKAREIGEGIAQGFSGSSSYVEPKKLTEFAPFSLSSSQRAKQVEKKEKTMYKPFKARPVPISTANVGAAHVEAKKLTKPLTPKLESLRLHKEAKLQQAAKIAAQREAEAKLARSFRAREIGEGVPAPNYSEASYQPPKLTEIKPFKFSIDPVGAKARREERERQQRIEKEKERVFKARSVPKTHNKPFALQKSSRVLCEPNKIILASEKRAIKRANFEKEVTKRRLEAERVEKERQEKALAERNAEIDAEMKALQFHKKSNASPAQVHQFLHKPTVAIKQSEVELCTPQSPHLLTSSRVRSLQMA